MAHSHPISVVRSLCPHPQNLGSSTIAFDHAFVLFCYTTDCTIFKEKKLPLITPKAGKSEVQMPADLYPETATCSFQDGSLDEALSGGRKLSPQACVEARAGHLVS